MNSRKKVFLLGVGCQKGGTTWLHKYLSSLRQCDLGFVKEYHVFDWLYVDDLRARHLTLLKKMTALLRKKERFPLLPRPRLDREIANLARLIMFNKSPALYADYFEDLWQKGSQTEVVGDITPDYALLTASELSGIRELLESRGFSVKVIFLLRDPVERCYSAIRSDVQHKLARGKRLDPFQLLREKYSSHGFECRTRYESIVRKLDATFPKADLYYGFYENLFTSVEISRINEFLGIDVSVPPDFLQRINSSLRESDVPPELARTIASHYAETYRFCSDRFGTEPIRRLWPNASLVG